MQSRKYTDLPLHFQPVISKMDMRRQTFIDNSMQPHLVAHVHQVGSLCICLTYHLQRLRQGLMGMSSVCRNAFITSSFTPSNLSISSEDILLISVM